MKKLIAISFFLSFAILTQAQVWVSATGDQAKAAKLTLVSGNAQSSTIQLNVEGYNTTTVQTPNGSAQKLSLENATFMLNAGAPELPKITASLVIPDHAEMEVNIDQSSYVDFPNVDIAPSKGNLTRDINPEDVPYSYGSVYGINKFYPGKLAELKDPYILRDLRGQTVVFYPYQYNPATRVLRVYTNIVVSVTQNGTSANNAFNRTKALTGFDREFAELYKHQFLNFNSTHKYTPITENGKMLIVCYDAYMSAMAPFVEWKKTEGLPCEIVSVTTAGSTAAAIKTYVTNYYNTNGLTFLLLVGDAAQLPTFTAAGGGSDPSFGYITGSDHYQEILVGRFSAENVAQVQTQVTRSVNYEKTPSIAPGNYNHAVGIGSAEGPGDDSEYDWEHQRNMLTDLLAFTYTTRGELYDGSQGGVDASGDATAGQLSLEVNEGTGIITYCGHGSDNSFVTTGFSNTNISSLTNTDILPFIWSVACVNGNFTTGTCFAEGWMRHTYNSQPAGAVATLMSTINQSWNPPMEGQDEMVDILVESYTSNIKRTFGGLSVNGIFKMNDTYSDFDMTDTWTLFGDPSLMVRTDDPASMTVTHTPTLNIGETSLLVNCNVNGALVCLTINHEIIGTGTVAGGNVTITFPALAQIDTITVCATAFNYIPYLGSVLVANTTGPYVAYTSNTVNDPTGNNNALADFGETVNLDVTLHNYGSATANAVTANITSANTYVNITDNNQSWGNITSGSDGVQSAAYSFIVAANVPDQQPMSFDLLIQDNAGGSWPASFTINANAPDFAVGQMTIDDASGNNNGCLDTSENVNIIINTLNNGHADAPNTSGVLTTATPQWVTITAGNHNFATMAQSSNADASFTLTVASSVPDSAIVELIYTVSSGAYSIIYHYFLTLGLVSEDWETGDFTLFDWTQGGDVPWVITSTGPYEGTYCAKSGTIADDQSSTLSVTMNVLAADTISFWKKVSSEQDYDYLTFKIDGANQGEWCGNVAWSKNAYPVSAGTHTYSWIYAKDEMIASGSDCAWLDYIMFPPIVSSYQNIEEQTSSISGLQCNPNPATGMTMIQFTMADAGSFSLQLMDITGRVVANLANEAGKPAGTYNFLFNAAAHQAGLYYIVLAAGNEQSATKVIITK